MSSEQSPRAWWTYWKDIEPKLAAYIEKSRMPIGQQYLENCLGFYSHQVEQIIKVQPKTAAARNLSVMVVETHDLLRGIVACHKDMTLAPLALLARSTFEIHCNLKYIIRSPDRENLAALYDRFSAVERLMGAKSSDAMPNPTEEDWKQLRQTHPEWFDTKGKLKDRLHWTGQAITVRDVAKAAHVGLEADYIAIYKTTSKFTHASPLVSNMYRKGGGLQFIPAPEQSTSLAILGVTYCLKTLEEYLSLVNLKWPALEVAEMNVDCLIAEDLVKGIRYSSLEEARRVVVARIIEAGKDDK